MNEIKIGVSLEVLGSKDEKKLFNKKTDDFYKIQEVGIFLPIDFLNERLSAQR